MKIAKTQLTKMIRETIREEMNLADVTASDVVGALDKFVTYGVSLGEGSFHGDVGDPREMVEQAAGGVLGPKHKAMLVEALKELLAVGYQEA